MQGQIYFDAPDRKKGYKCSCCGQFVKVYHRKLNSSMACVLLLIYRSGKRNFFHVENWLKEVGRSELRADFHKLRFWKFLEPKHEEREDGSNRNGQYKITGLGIMFCEDKITAKERAVIYNNKLEYLEGAEITITTALGRKFNYKELMEHEKQPDANFTTG